MIILIIFTFIGDPKPIDEQDMGDPNKKELSDEEMDSFDEKRGEATDKDADTSGSGAAFLSNLLSPDSDGQNTNCKKGNKAVPISNDDN